MKRYFNPAIGDEIHAPKSALAWAVLGAALLLVMCVPGRAMAQADPGPMPPPAVQQDSADAPHQAPLQKMRPAGMGAFPLSAVEFSALTQEFNAKLSAALADWTDLSGAARKPKIIVLDFSTSDNRWPPFGAWLADKFSLALSSNNGKFEVIDRAQLAASLAARHLAPQDLRDSKTAADLAQSLGADLLLTGKYSALDKDLGLAINARRASAIERPRPILFIKYRVAMSDEITGHLGEPLESLAPKREADPYASRPDVHTPGRDGVTNARCTYCPAAEYSETGRRKKIDGAVVLSVLVTPEGRASEIQVTKSLEPSLDQQAVKAVSTWKFEPAKDSNGTPVTIHLAIEVSFHLY